MKPLFLAGPLVLCVFTVAPYRADPAEAERQGERALIERDRQAAEFSRPELRDMPRRSEAEPLRPDERVQQAREREVWLRHLPPPPAAPASGESAKPLPLPGGPGHAVDPVPIQGSRG
jgi:hypothetical protein